MDERIPVATLQARPTHQRCGDRTAAFEIVNEMGISVALVLGPTGANENADYNPQAVSHLLVAAPDLYNAAHSALEEVAAITVTKAVDFDALEKAYRALEDATDLAIVGREPIEE